MASAYAQFVREKNANAGPSVYSLTPPDVWSPIDSIIPLETQPLPHVPARIPALIIKGLLSAAECRALIEAFPLLRDGPGYMPPHEVARRYRDRVVHRHLVHDQALSDVLWPRIRTLLPSTLDGGELRGLSPYWRLLHYEKGGHQGCHVDGREPAEPRVEAPTEQQPGEAWVQSRLTLQLYLNNGGGDQFEGGELSFFDSKGQHMLTRLVPTQGDCVAFYQEASAPYALLHEGSDVTAGNKFAMRTMVEYSFKTPEEASQNHTVAAAVAAPP